ncbi:MULTISPECIES: FAD-dependent oxidoreductase [unclassified Mesorhizobium]|uniref:NAD(P)/FAD-dependent oxidoreductase n=1 Tax=unclassified Mesorhizobium TaxID=325217 RepID=UPI0010924D74|nr:MULTISPECIES: FAD-dependent oxidoreductase [unclassified Mesorhizobium]TGS43742.1 FAD-dependent oxidoreductase [Mesorhizobium sp. M8A.F.Ca.ET.182.01.1.1]TGS78323.1 FAD-dependent oxidoreductase [Mesorhizobium sp. M8A.F.Ca.ET.181.01.1.1]TGV15461.1 FAD-dependent oxidoreductase [Mesorhizobium sp. M8A.F.Ca.ET.173.01.1.1]
MRVGIVGAGIVGLATAWALRSRGHDVTVFDRGPIPNPMASSYDEQRYHRFAYGRMAGYAKLALGVTDAWDVLWNDLQETLYIETGVLYVADAANEDVALSVAFAQDNGMVYHEIDDAEFVKRFPHLRPRLTDRAVLFPQSGILLAERILVSLARWLIAKGASLRPYARVDEVDHDRARVRVLGAWEQFDQVVVAAGSWTGELVPNGNELEPSRMLMLLARPPERLAKIWSTAPALADWTVEDNFYVTPPLRGTQMKMTFDLPFERNDPNTTREASPAEISTVTGIAREALASFDEYQILGGRACYYTNTFDRAFFVRGHGRSWAISTCSGHGFKFGAMTGMTVADAVEGKISTAELRHKLEAKAAPSI